MPPAKKSRPPKAKETAEEKRQKKNLGELHDSYLVTSR